MNQDVWQSDRQMRRIEVAYQAGEFPEALAMLEAYELDFEWQTDEEEAWADLRRAQLQIEAGDWERGLNDLRRYFIEHGYAGFEDDDLPYLERIDDTVSEQLVQAKRVGVGLIIVNLIPIVLLAIGYRPGWLIPAWIGLFIVSAIAYNAITPHRTDGDISDGGDVGLPP